MKERFELGATHTAHYEIDKDRTIEFMGEEFRVYATPVMVRDMENTCRLFLKDIYPDEDEDSVGARVEIDHIGPTLVGMHVEIKITVAEIKGLKVTFEFEVHDQIEQFGRGKHLRFVVLLEKQCERLERKRWQLRR